MAIKDWLRRPGKGGPKAVLELPALQTLFAEQAPHLERGQIEADLIRAAGRWVSRPWARADVARGVQRRHGRA